jgi:hypothetical protein
LKNPFVFEISNSTVGGIALFAIAIAFAAIELYFIKKANQSFALRQGIKDESTRAVGRERRCKEAGGQWFGKCCLGAKYPSGVRECSTN